MTKILLSIIIPALNEEKNLPSLLKSIKKQSFKDYEVIIADAGSKDKTKIIALEYGCKIIKGGKPAVGRNNGAKIAKGDYFLFLDSDVRLSQNDYLSRLMSFAKNKKIEVATSKIIPLSKRWDDKIMHSFSNFMMRIFSIFSHITPGYCIFVSKKQFNNAGGFKNIVFDDIDFGKRIKGKSGFLSTPIFISVRRFDKDGRLNMYIRIFKLFIYSFIGKDITKFGEKEHKFDIYK